MERILERIRSRRDNRVEEALTASPSTKDATRAKMVFGSHSVVLFVLMVQLRDFSNVV